MAYFDVYRKTGRAQRYERAFEQFLWMEDYESETDMEPSAAGRVSVDGRLLVVKRGRSPWGPSEEARFRFVRGELAPFEVRWWWPWAWPRWALPDSTQADGSAR